MKRWQVWTSVVTGTMSIVAPGTYFGWKQLARNSAEAVVSDVKGAANESASETPKPIPLPFDGPSSFNSVSPASFNEPASGSAGEHPPSASAVPARPSAAFNPISSETSFSAVPPSESPASAPQNSFDTGFQGGPAPISSSPPAESFDRSPPPSEFQGGEPARPSTRFVMNDEAPPTSQLSDELPPGATADVNASETTELPAEEIADATPPEAIDHNAGADQLPPSNSFPDRPTARFADEPRSSAISSRFQDEAPAATRSLGSPRMMDAEQIPESRPIGQSSTMASSLRASAVPAATLTSDAPGERKIEGVQTPTLSLEKTIVDEIQVGKPARFTIKVRNVGSTAAHGVVVTDRVPQGTEFVEAAPETVPSRDGAVVWELGTLEAGEESIITFDVLPQTEGEIGSVAQVSFHAQAGARTIATRPLLTVEHSGPAKVLIGEDVPFQITVSNPGSGVATGVIVEVDVPEQLMHEGGREIMSDKFDLRPNETRKLDLVLRAIQPGMVNNIVRAVGDANIKAEHRTQLEVVAPQLVVGVSGPTRRYLERQVTYQVTVSNPGTAAAGDIELITFLPQGLKFVSADKKGQYDQRKHAVLWSLEELPAGESGAVQLTAIPVDTGEQKLHVEGRANLDLSAKYDHTTLVEALTELVFTVSDENDPIEVGAETSYEIRIMNNGVKKATNVQLAAELPADMAIVDATGPTKAEVQGQQIIMQPIAQLGAREEAVYHIVVQGRKEGDHLIRVQIISDEFSTPVTKEESTKVYADK